MVVYIVPPVMKSGTAILSWLIPMCYVTEYKQEFISEYAEVPVCIRGRTKAFSKWYEMALDTSLDGRTHRIKISVDVNSLFQAGIEQVLADMTEDKNFATINGEYHLLNNTGVELVRKVYENLDEDLRPQISPPRHWYVYIPKSKVLTRLVFTRKISGKITIKPAGLRNILLEVDNATLGQVNKTSLKELKAGALKLERLDSEWRTLLRSREIEEAIEMFVGEEEEETTATVTEQEKGRTRVEVEE